MRFFEWGKPKAEVPEFPVEFDDGDRAIIRYVVAKKLSMTGRERLFATLMACRHVARAGIEGDFVECGVWRGGNALIAADVFSRHAIPAHIYLFDTFAGMTEPTAQDVEQMTGEQASARYARAQRKAHNDWCYSSLEEVKKNFRDAGLLSENVKMIQGDVMETLSDEDNLPRRISVLRLDTDWHKSTKKELEVLWPRLESGGILIIDDYGHWGGARKAVDEYFAVHGRPFLHYIDYTGRLAVKP